MISASKVLMLIRREMWENRSLWITPLVIAGVLLVSAAISGSPVVDGHGGLHIGPSMSPEALPPHPEASRRDGIYAGYISVLTLVQLGVLGIVVFFYLLDSLLSERKDRSILFWKSLPISDSEVVLSKAATALVVAPAIVLAVSAVTQVLFGAILWLRFHDSVLGGWITGWNPAIWLQVQVGFLALVCAVVVWYLPLAGYLLLVSVWARKNAFLWAVLPPAAVLLIEAMILQSHNFADFLGRRFAGVFMVMKLPEHDSDSMQSLGEFLSHVGRVFAHPATWLGVLVAVGFIVAVIRIRRYRDDS
jgi:ABC-2 type transport system permease protein